MISRSSMRELLLARKGTQWCGRRISGARFGEGSPAYSGVANSERRTHPELYHYFAQLLLYFDFCFADCSGAGSFCAFFHGSFNGTGCRSECSADRCCARNFLRFLENGGGALLCRASFLTGFPSAALPTCSS